MEQVILPEGGLDLPKLLSEIEDYYIQQAMARSGNHIGGAARLLGLGRTTLREKLRRKGFINQPVRASIEDPEGEFTIRKVQKGYDVLFNGELIENKKTLEAANSLLKEKMNE